MVEASLRGQLGGGVAWDWDPAGLRCAMTVPLGRVAEPGMASGAGTG
jgi:hypothetical protein